MQRIAWLLLAFSFSVFAGNTPTKFFDGDKYRYSIRYPANWQVYDHDDGIVVFKQQSGSSTYPSSVNIQTIFTKKAHGTYKNVKELMDAFTQDSSKHVTDVHFIMRQPITLTEPNGKKVHGEETMMTFKDHGKMLKQWQVMVVTQDGKLFQAWAYRASNDKFEEDMNLAKDMLQSWRIQ